MQKHIIKMAAPWCVSCVLVSYGLQKLRSELHPFMAARDVFTDLMLIGREVGRQSRVDLWAKSIKSARRVTKRGGVFGHKIKTGGPVSSICSDVRPTRGQTDGWT